MDDNEEQPFQPNNNNFFSGPDNSKNKRKTTSELENNNEQDANNTSQYQLNQLDGQNSEVANFDDFNENAIEVSDQNSEKQQQSKAGYQHVNQNEEEESPIKQKQNQDEQQLNQKQKSRGGNGDGGQGGSNYFDQNQQKKQQHRRDKFSNDQLNDEQDENDEVYARNQYEKKSTQKKQVVEIAAMPPPPPPPNDTHHKKKQEINQSQYERQKDSAEYEQSNAYNQNDQEYDQQQNYGRGHVGHLPSLNNQKTKQQSQDNPSARQQQQQQLQQQQHQYPAGNHQSNNGSMDMGDSYNKPKKKLEPIHDQKNNGSNSGAVRADQRFSPKTQDLSPSQQDHGQRGISIPGNNNHTVNEKKNSKAQDSHTQHHNPTSNANTHKNQENHDDHPPTHKAGTQHDKNDKQDEDQPKEELDPAFDEPMPPFTVSRNDLIKIASAAQTRHFAEEVDLIESIGGPLYLMNGLQSNVKQGISCTEEDYNNRDRAFTNNLKKVSPPKGLLELFIGALDDFTMKVLIVAAFFSIAIEVGTASDSKRSIAWIEGVAILVAVSVCASVTAINDYQKEKQFQQLNNEADKRKIVTVIRNGNKENMHMSKVMVGDIIELVEGMEIPADGIVLEASELTTDESAMTGETDPMKKNTMSECVKKRNEIIEQGIKNVSTSHDVPSPCILSGTRILTGQGKMMVIVVGDFSCVGKISKLLNSKDAEATPLQEKLEAIAMDIGNVGLKASILIVIVLLIRFAIEKITKGEWDHSHDWAEMLEFLIIGITVVVVAIPEGLPLSVTLSLAYSVKKMLKDNNLVRKLQACETMGGADCICSDKTGTLTQNKMTLTTWWNEETQEFEKYNDTANLDDYIPSNQKAFQKLFLQSCAINSSADLRPEEKGSKTEVAVLKLIEKFDERYEKWREQYIAEATFPFSSARKRMSIIINSDGKRIILVKGASELVLASCNKFLSKKTGKVRPIDEDLLSTMKTAIKSMADNALRTIVLAYKELRDDEDIVTKDRLGVFDVETKELTCIAIFGIKDILRPEVPDAVKQCQDAGIKVRMVTGDNQDTARAIARDCNILTKGKKSPYQVIEGSEFIKLTGGIICKNCKTFECGCTRDREEAEKENKPLRVDVIKNGEVFDKIYQDIDVMARSRPEDKYAMVVGLIERKHVVAVTGDGTNDAPALKKADVGFAMGIAGTEVARGAAAIILLDDNFKSIVSAVMWGRNIYDCIKKFLQFQLTVNVVAVGITLIGAGVIKQEILTPIQMLWINLIMDTLASLALATEPPSEELLLRKPHNRDEYIVTKKMFKHVFGEGIYQLVILMIFVFNGEKFLPEESDSFDDELKSADSVEKLKKIGLTEWWQAKYSDSTLQYLRSGRLRSYDGQDREYIDIYDEFHQPSRHFTCIFNLFVMMQIFNFLNARKLQDELNIFEGLTRNSLFIGIVFFIFGLQALLIQVGSLPFYCYKNGLTGGQWGITIAFGAGSLFWGFFLKFISEDKCAQFGKKKVNPLHNTSRILSLKGQRNEASMSRRYSALIAHPTLKH